MASVDVTVRGAGIFGLATAYACRLRGACVRVVDPAGVGAGASGGIVGALAPHAPETWNAKKAFQFESLMMAAEFWAGVARVGGQDPGYARLGRLQPIADARARDLAQARAVSAEELWCGAAHWRVVALDDTDTALRPLSPTGLVIVDTLSARLHPRKACNALAAALRASGVEILTEAPKAGIEILATGWEGLRALSEGRARPLGSGVKGQAVLLGHAAPRAPQIFADGLHIVPHGDGTTAIGSTSERDFTDPAATDEQCDRLLDAAHAVCPALRGAPVLERWAGVRPRARSRAPMLGAHPEARDVFIVNGGFKIGFGMAPKIAEVMADLVLEGRDRIPDGFRVGDNF